MRTRLFSLYTLHHGWDCLLFLSLNHEHPERKVPLLICIPQDLEGTC